jgi:hypothetical protein
MILDTANCQYMVLRVAGKKEKLCNTKKTRNPILKSTGCHQQPDSPLQNVNNYLNTMRISMLTGFNITIW